MCTRILVSVRCWNRSEEEAELGVLESLGNEDQVFRATFPFYPTHPLDFFLFPELQMKRYKRDRCPSIYTRHAVDPGQLGAF